MPANALPPAHANRLMPSAGSRLIAISLCLLGAFFCVKSAWQPFALNQALSTQAATVFVNTLCRQLDGCIRARIDRIFVSDADTDQNGWQLRLTVVGSPPLNDSDIRPTAARLLGLSRSATLRAWADHFNLRLLTPAAAARAEDAS